MCLACEQDAIWFAYLESRGLLQPDDSAAVDALFGAFPVQPLPMQQQGGEGDAAGAPAEIANKNKKIETNPFTCDDPSAE